MNRSFIAPEGGMQGPKVKQRREMGSLRGSVAKEKEEELGWFLEMRKREKERSDLLLFQNTEEFDAPLVSRMGGSPIYSMPSTLSGRKAGVDDFLNSENDKNDYDWLLTPPGTPPFPSLEMESQRTVMSQIGTPKARPTVLKSRLANPQPEPTAKSNLASRQPASSPGLNTSTAGAIRRASPSRGLGYRPSTPTGRPMLTSSKPTLTASKPTLTSSSKTFSTSSSKPTSIAVAKPSRSSTPTSRPSLPATNSTLPTRSYTPTARSTARSSTPTSRPTLPATKPPSRSATPTRRPATLSTTSNTSTPPNKSPSSLVTKPITTAVKHPVVPRAGSPVVRPRPWKPSEMPGYSLDTPPNLRTTLLDRPLSRGRSGGPAPRSSSVEPVGSNGRVRRQSCSPSRGRPPNNISSGGSVPVMNREYAKENNNVSPIVYSTKMVERVINMRKLVPPKQDDKHSPRSNVSGKLSSSPDSSGFGRTLSNKSLDMAIRHMDIRRTIPGNLRPLMTNIPASSMYSVRSGPTRSRTVSILDSPIATSSNASSEVSVNNNGLCSDGNVDDDINSERVRAPLPSCEAANLKIKMLFPIL